MKDSHRHKRLAAHPFLPKVECGAADNRDDEEDIVVRFFPSDEGRLVPDEIEETQSKGEEKCTAIIEWAVMSRLAVGRQDDETEDEEGGEDDSPSVYQRDSPDQTRVRKRIGRPT